MHFGAFHTCQKAQHICLQLPICSPSGRKRTHITEKMSCYRATVTDKHFSPFTSTWIRTWLPVCQGNIGYLEVLIKTVKITKGSFVFTWYSVAFPAQSYQARPTGSVLNSRQPGFAGKNTVWWCESCCSYRPFDPIPGHVCHLLARGRILYQEGAKQIGNDVQWKHTCSAEIEKGYSVPRHDWYKRRGNNPI